MSVKHKTHDAQRIAVVQRARDQAVTENEPEKMPHPAVALGQIVRKAPANLTPANVLTLQRVAGNRVVQRLLGNQIRPPLISLPKSTLTIQRQPEAEEETLQGKFEAPPRAENRTGLPDKLKAGIENLSGLAMDDVRVHYNSAKPAEVRALAHTQGADIHVGPGQERHLPHEAWHVVQQKRGGVRPTLHAHSVPINDDEGLEQEADLMGARALSESSEIVAQPRSVIASAGADRAVQRKVGFEFETHWALEKPANVAWTTNSKIVSGTGWQLSPDELKGNKGVIEFKTDPYEVEGDDTDTLGQTIKTSFAHLKAYGDKLVALKAKGKVPDAAEAFKNVEVTPNDDQLAARPQVTGGVREDLILKFLGDTSKSKEDTEGADLMPGEERKDPMIKAGRIAMKKGDLKSAKDKKYAGTVTLLAFYIRRAYQQYEGVMAQVREWSKTYIQAMNLADPTIKEQMRSEYNTAKMAEMKKRAPSYAKGIASVLPRVRFAKLPEISRVTLLKDVVEAAGLEEYEKGKQAWPAGLKVLDDEWGRFDETIEAWIKNIQAENPTGSLKDADFWGEREIAAGEVGAGDKKGAGILFELRGQEGGLTYDKYFTYAKPFLKYFRELNMRAKPAKD
jgi:Domain of unknown function (DUF4157)